MIMSPQNLLTGGNDGRRRTREDGLERQRGFGAGLGPRALWGKDEAAHFSAPCGITDGGGVLLAISAELPRSY